MSLVLSIVALVVATIALFLAYRAISALVAIDKAAAEANEILNLTNRSGSVINIPKNKVWAGITYTAQQRIDENRH